MTSPRTLENVAEEGLKVKFKREDGKSSVVTGKPMLLLFFDMGNIHSLTFLNQFEKLQRPTAPI